MKHILYSLLIAVAVGAVPAALAQQAMPSGAQPPPAGPSASGQALPTAGPPGRLAALAPPGMSMQDACSGFRNLGQCSAALHAAQNLEIPFADLKGKVTGGESLDQAIRTLKPGSDGKSEAHKAQEQAYDDMRAPRG